MDEVTLELPVPPSANEYWQYSRGHVYTSQVARDYKRAVSLLIPRQVMSGEVCLNISVYRARKIGDLDNYLKIMLDALKGILYHDDNQIIEIHSFRYDDKANPRVILVAWEAEKDSQ